MKKKGTEYPVTCHRSPVTGGSCHHAFFRLKLIIKFDRSVGLNKEAGDLPFLNNKLKFKF